eukprot:SAG22_NODE_281_length_13064_cov_13.367605_6_plen_152_part_00
MPTSRAKKAAAEPALDVSGDLEQDAAKVVLSEEAEAAERAAEAASRRAVEEARTALEAKLDALTGQKAGAGGAGSGGELEEEANEVAKEEAAASGPPKKWGSEEELQFLQAKYIQELQAQGKDAAGGTGLRMPSGGLSMHFPDILYRMGDA